MYHHTFRLVVAAVCTMSFFCIEQTEASGLIKAAKSLTKTVKKAPKKTSSGSSSGIPWGIGSRLMRSKPCPSCNGSGEIKGFFSNSKCSRCSGSGKVRD